MQLTEYIKNNPDVNLFIRQLLALAFLPEEMIRPAFQQLIEGLSRLVHRRVGPVINYFNNFWLDRIGPMGFSVFGLAMRTNNCIESYHSRLLHRLGVHPTAWAFICKFIRIFKLLIFFNTILINLLFQASSNISCKRRGRTWPQWKEAVPCRGKCGGLLFTATTNCKEVSNEMYIC